MKKTAIGGGGLAGIVALLYALFGGGGKPAAVDHTHDAEFTTTCSAIWQEELGRAIDPPALEDCVDRARKGAHEPELRQPVHDSPEAVAYRARIEEPPPAPVTLAHAGEAGALHVVGLSIRDDHGLEWRYRGFTDFKLFRRFLDGEDLQPLLTERVELGANTLRVLLTAAALFDLRPDQYSDAQLDAFLELLASRGLRCECVILVDANPKEKFGLRGTLPTVDLQRAFVARIAAVLNRHWNASPSELCNECSHEITQIDRAAFQKPSGPTLWERGSGQGDEAPFTPAWDLVGDHPGRQTDWPRRLTCRDIRSNDGPPWGIRVACVENEPMGAAEVEQPGRRATNADDFAQFAAHCALNGNGCLFHSEDGIQSRRLGPVQAAAARAFFAALRWVPVNAPTWPYRRGGLSGPQASCIAHEDTKALRTFSKDNGAECWTVAIRPSADWQPIGVDGWRVADSPRRGLVRLTR